MKIFVSWSSGLSHTVAEAFAEWIHDIIQETQPFISSEMEKGIRWFEELTAQLKDTNYGVICLTRENLHSDWLLFEAGALSKLEKAKVSVLLIGLDDVDVKGPLSNFQSTKFERKEFFRLVQGINSNTSSPLNYPDLERAFSKWWDGFEEKVNEALRNVEGAEKPGAGETRGERDILEEILQNTRDLGTMLQQRPTSGTNELMRPPFNTLFDPTINAVDYQMLKRFSETNEPLAAGPLSGFSGMDEPSIRDVLGKLHGLHLIEPVPHGIT